MAAQYKLVADGAAYSGEDLLQQLAGSEPMPDVAAQVAEEAERLLRQSCRVRSWSSLRC